jgi:hypothetical protein
MGGGAGHRWKFFRACGLDQVMFRTGGDLVRLAELDQKLWVVLSCPARGVMFDARTLELIDTNHDGRIHAPELLDAVQWAVARVRNADDLLQGAAALPLAAIHEDTPEGARLLATARRILAHVGKPGAQAIAPEDIAARVDVMKQMRFNGDGVVPPAAADDPEVRTAMEDVIRIMGGETDRDGTPGVNLLRLTAFFQAVEKFDAWWQEAEHQPEILPLGAETAAAAACWQAVRSKVDDYFARCRLARYHAQAQASLNATAEDFAAMARQELSLTSPAIAALPLATVAPDRPLPLADGLNPYWAAALEAFRRQTLAPLFPGSANHLTEETWQALGTRLRPYEAWLARKAGAAVESLGVVRLRRMLAAGIRDRIEALIRQDSEQECEHTLTEAVEKLILLNRDLVRLLNNFVSFADFYDPRRTEIFQAGRLYIAGRYCDLCVSVEEVDRHAMQAASSKLFLAYCELSQAATGAKRYICAAVTAGFAETLWVGRNGIFYDREQRCWDAVIVRIVDGPISLKEAFWAPWKKIATMISDQIRKLVMARQEAALQAAARSVEQTAARAPGVSAAAPVPPPAAALPRMDGAAMASSVAALGIAVGLLGSAVGGLLGTVSKLPLWKSLVGVLLVILSVSGPSVILAYFKLRSRDLAPVLNACRWAVNRRIRMTMLLGHVFTQEAALPEGAERQLTDPYADKNHARLTLLLGVLAAALALVVWLWAVGWWDAHLPAAWHRRTVCGS